MLSIHSLRFATQGWTLKQETEFTITWSNQFSDVLDLKFIPVRTPALPVRLDDAAGLFQHYQREIAQQQGHLITCELRFLAGARAVYLLYKRSQGDGLGLDYSGGIIFPFRDLSYVITIFCREWPPTGLREVLVFPTLLKEAPIDSRSKEEQLLALARSHAADAEAYDAIVPDHPLSRWRSYARAIQASLQIDSDVRNRPPFMP